MNSLSKNDTQLYFAFGSNMSNKQVHERCPSAKKVALGFIPNYDLVFNRKGSYRPGGVASIEPTNEPERSVYGIIWEISKEDLNRLDEIEDLTAYERVIFDVSTLNGESCKCQTYVAYPQAEYVVPDPHYFELLINAAKETHLPQEYINHISKLLPSK